MTRTRPAGAHRRVRGSGLDAVAAEGIVSQPIRSRDSAPSAPPSSRQSRAGRAARSAARRRRGPDDLRAGPRSPRARAPGSGTRSGASPARRGRRCRRSSARSSGAKPNSGRGAPTGSVAPMRRPSTVEVMLLTTIGLWALNLTVSRYILTHGFQPLAYAASATGSPRRLRALALAVERSLRISRRDLPLVARRGRRAVRQPDRVRLRAEDDVGVRPRADPRRDADLRRARRARAPHGAAVVALLGRRAPLLQRSRARRARVRRRALGRPRRRAARRSSPPRPGRRTRCS